jgi:hypothetical protein
MGPPLPHPSIDELAQSVANVITDYRADEGIGIDVDHVLRWVTQFDQPDRMPVISELAHVLPERYLSKTDTQKFLRNVLKKLSEVWNGGDIGAFLGNTEFLDLQEEGKSQSDLLDLLDGILVADHARHVADCGGGNPVRYVYLDDVLCTGNTAFYDLTGWLSADEGSGKTRLDRLGSAEPVVLVFDFVHNLNWYKLRARLRYWNPRFVPRTIWRAVEVDNDRANAGSQLDFVFPTRGDQPAAVIQYAQALAAPEAEVFRVAGRPADEGFFSSPVARSQFENILLKKGLELIAAVANPIPNMRPLGYTLPSQRNLGFGALCFTWRNVPNNTPLVFWYEAGGWMPLFPKKAYAADFGF